MKFFQRDFLYCHFWIRRLNQRLGCVLMAAVVKTVTRLWSECSVTFLHVLFPRIFKKYKLFFQSQDTHFCRLTRWLLQLKKLRKLPVIIKPIEYRTLFKMGTDMMDYDWKTLVDTYLIKKKLHCGSSSLMKLNVYFSHDLVRGKISYNLDISNGKLVLI